ncbi:hypothetical protein KFK09_015460 [Dendrobium nobile]|uniref:ERCC4 domain-containing protein n=1 Tax=Dendrobium nobile TaxID=94219 RepID=A0A8T3B601_DENNO|nr:hypothetical protein KFK09_015460 [Dendrobium nobile]
MLKKIGSATYRLKLPPTTIIHLMFHMSQLRRAFGDHASSVELPVTLIEDLEVVLEPLELNGLLRPVRSSALFFVPPYLHFERGFITIGNGVRKTKRICEYWLVGAIVGNAERDGMLSNMMSDVPYILLLYQAEEFCDLVVSESLIGHVHTVRSQYPLFTICYLTNKLMSFINKCEQSHYKNSSNFNSYKRPPAEEVLAKLSTHFTKVHSRQCIDEAEIADHIVGLTSSLANCQFRKKLTWLSVNANGSMVAKNLIKNNVWLKALAAIPEVQPKHAIAIWKKYPSMRSLLDVYLDSNKSVHEKEFLLKDLMVEGSLGIENRRFG